VGNALPVAVAAAGFRAAGRAARSRVRATARPASGAVGRRAGLVLHERSRPCVSELSPPCRRRRRPM